MSKKKRRESVTHQIMNKVIEIQNDKTPHDLSRKQYIKNTKKFIKFCREKHSCKTFDECRNYIQAYSDYLQSENFSPSTITTYLAAACSTFSVSMQEISKPIRRAGDYTRGRLNKCNSTKQDLNDPEYIKLVEFQKRIGIRRNELLNLTGECFVYDESNYPCVLVKRGKGRKTQLQRINKPEDVEFIKTYFEGKGSDEPIFDPELLSNDLNLHKLRAFSAQEYYEIQLYRIQNEPGYAEQLASEIEKRWKLTNFNKNTGKPKPFDKSRLEGWYVCRGSVRQAALKNGRPIKYNRLAVASVSLFKLSHYRLSVTVENYLIL